MTFFGEMLKFFRQTPKMVIQKFRYKFGPPVYEVLDLLVYLTYSNLFIVLSLHSFKAAKWCKNPW